MWQFLSRRSIDLDNWDQEIELKKLPYEMYSWYLNIVTPQWKVLHHRETGTKLPLPYIRKYGIFPRVFRPPYLQHVSFIKDKAIDKTSIQELNTFLKKNFKKSDLCFEYIPKELLEINDRAIYRPNYILHFNKELYYHRGHQRKIRKIQSDLFQIAPISTDEFMSAYKKYINTDIHHRYRDPRLTKKLIRACLKNNMGFLRAVRNDQRDLLCACFFGKDGNRLVYLVPFSTPEGKRQHAMFFLIHKMIQEYKDTAYYLDWEGSAIPGIARFMLGFGSEKEEYCLWRFS